MRKWNGIEVDEWNFPLLPNGATRKDRSPDRNILAEIWGDQVWISEADLRFKSEQVAISPEPPVAGEEEWEDEIGFGLLEGDDDGEGEKTL